MNMISKKLKETRTKLGLKQSEVAEQLGCAPTWLRSDILDTLGERQGESTVGDAGESMRSLWNFTSRSSKSLSDDERNSQNSSEADLIAYL